MNGCIWKTEDGKCKKFTTDKITSYCVEGPCEFEKTSNADRIRTMTDEELAEFLFRKVQDIFDCRVFGCSEMLAWLKQEGRE